MTKLANDKKSGMVEYLCSPKPEGKAYICFAAIIAITSTIRITIKDIETTDTIIFSLVIYSIAAALAATGVYLWRFRYKPLKRTVILGTRQHRLYRRSRMLFTLYTFIIYTFIFTISIVLIDFIACGFRFKPDVLYQDISRGLWSMFLLIPYKTVTSYLSYYQYFLSDDTVYTNKEHEL